MFRQEALEIPAEAPIVLEQHAQSSRPQLEAHGKQGRELLAPAHLTAARGEEKSGRDAEEEYGQRECTQRGQRISNWRKERSSSKIKSTNDTWPISTPTLKLTMLVTSPSAESAKSWSFVARPNP
jgi:hypothetical protein